MKENQRGKVHKTTPHGHAKKSAKNPLPMQPTLICGCMAAVKETGVTTCPIVQNNMFARGVLGVY